MTARMHRAAVAVLAALAVGCGVQGVTTETPAPATTSTADAEADQRAEAAERAESRAEDLCWDLLLDLEAHAEARDRFDRPDSAIARGASLSSISEATERLRVHAAEQREFVSQLREADCGRFISELPGLLDDVGLELREFDQLVAEGEELLACHDFVDDFLAHGDAWIASETTRAEMAEDLRVHAAEQREFVSQLREADCGRFIDWLSEFLDEIEQQLREVDQLALEIGVSAEEDLCWDLLGAQNVHYDAWIASDWLAVKPGVAWEPGDRDEFGRKWDLSKIRTSGELAERLRVHAAEQREFVSQLREADCGRFMDFLSLDTDEQFLRGLEQLAREIERGLSP